MFKKCDDHLVDGCAMRAGQLSQSRFPRIPSVRMRELEHLSRNRHGIGSGNPHHTQTAASQGSGDSNDSVVRVQATASR